MGADGGSIPTRRELVKTKSSRTEKADQNVQTYTHWYLCALSRAPLQIPVVSCMLGRLYNKDAVLRFLLESKADAGRPLSDGDVICGHIKSLRDVMTLQLTPNPQLKDGVSGTFSGIANPIDLPSAPFICPITLREMNGKTRFCYYSGCGCVVSETAVKELSTVKDSKVAKDKEVQDESAERCIICEKRGDLIGINETGERELARLLERMTHILDTREKTKFDKKRDRKDRKEKKRKHVEMASPDGVDHQPSQISKPKPVAPGPSISISMPDLSGIDAKAAQSRKILKTDKQRAAAATKDVDKHKPGNDYLVMGTFTRYSAY